MTTTIQLKTILLTLLLTWIFKMTLTSQTYDDSLRIQYKDKSAVVLPKSNGTITKVSFIDSTKTILVAISTGNGENHPEEEEVDSLAKKIVRIMKKLTHSGDTVYKRSFIETEWLHRFDVGFSNLGPAGGGDFDGPYKNLNTNLGKSANLHLNIVQQSMNLYREKLLFSYGFGLSSHYLKMTERRSAVGLDTNGFLTAVSVHDPEPRKNRLDLHYLCVPVMLEFKSKPSNESKGFGIAAGIEYNFNARANQVIKQNRGEGKSSSKLDIGLNPSYMNAVVRIGVKGFSFYGRYSLTPVFKDKIFPAGQNPDAQLFSFGVCVFGI